MQTRAIYGFFFDNSSHYSGFLTQLKLTGYHGATLQGTYTWGECTDYGSSTQSPTTYQNTLPGLIYFDKQMRKGQCDYSITQNFTANGLYEIPTHFNSELLRTVAGGWQVGGIFFASTGVPFTLINPGDVLGQKGTSFAPLPDFSASCNPCNTNYKTGSHYYVNTTCFPILLCL